MITYDNAFFVVTSDGNYGKGINLIEATKNARISKTTKQVVVTVMLFAPNTKEEIKQHVVDCYCVNDFGQVCQCLDLDRQDETVINENLLGFTQYYAKNEVTNINKR